MLVTALWPHSARAELAGTKSRDRQVVIAVASLLRSDHLSKHPLDDEMSRMCFQAFLKTLDPWKDYFLQSDIDAFSNERDQLDDQLKRGDVSFAYIVFKTLLVRMDERAKLADEILAKEIDFTADEARIIDFDKLAYAKNDEEVADKWRKRVKYELLIHKAEGMSDADARAKVSRHCHGIPRRMHQLSDDDLVELYLNAVASCFDPHTSYMSPATAESFEIEMRLQLDGIGAQMQSDDGYAVIASLTPGGAADKDGRLKPKDQIIGVGQGTGGEIVDVSDLSVTEIVKLVRGKRGTVVRLKVIPAGKLEPKIYDITRDSIALKEREARGEVIADRAAAPYKIGVIDLPSFYMDMSGSRQGLPDFKSTTRDIRKILADFRAKDVDAVVLDLRRNGGGSVPEAISLTGLFIDQGPIAQVKDATGRVQRYDDPEKGADWNGPLVVLTSKFSASASEMFAGAIKDYRRGLIVGDRATHGKGIVQGVLDLSRLVFKDVAAAPPLGTLKITMQQFYRPNGDSTQERGIEADVELPSITTYLDVGEQDLEHHMKFDHVPLVSFTWLGMVDSQTTAELRVLSEKRCEASTDFAKVRQDIERLKQRKERKSIPLNEQKFFAERRTLQADDDPDDAEAAKGAVIKRDYYFNEALSVTVDYVRMLKTSTTVKNGKPEGTS